jgi:16S rRNA (guanine966-N2)-methyltransferase
MSSIRIIGGKHRSRKIEVPELEGLRPTPNRVRETLFNWLTHDIVGKTCLDAFAGTGALGFEALSRGAASITFVDKQPIVINHLKNIATILKETSCYFLLGHIEKLDSLKIDFDIVFLDPPFYKNLIIEACHFLVQKNLLRQNALIYIERESTLKNIELPSSFTLLKEKIAGDVHYSLWRFLKN